MVSQQQLNTLLECLYKANKLSNNPFKIQKVLIDEYGVYSSIKEIKEWLNPTINELIADNTILSKSLGINY